MSRYDDYDDDYQDLAREVAYTKRKQRRLSECQCGSDMPGTCPGPRYCPHADLDNEDND